MPNDDITSSQKILTAMHYFVGGSPADIMLSHGIGYSDVYPSVWEIVDTINLCGQLKIKLPNHEDQSRIASK